MIRTLIIITGVGAFVAAVCLTTAWAIAARDIAAHGWSWNDNWHIGWSDDDDGHDISTATRQIAWPGGASLSTDAPVTIRYTQKPGPATVEISGPRDIIDDVTIENGEIELDSHSRRARSVTVLVTAPGINRFSLADRSRLSVEGYDQDRLDLSLTGRASAEVRGRTHDVVLAMSGRGEADLAQLVAEDAKVAISGAGEATIAPTTSASVGISGHGQVTLLTHPRNVTTDISGDGRLSQVGGDATPTPPTPPAKH